ncbi:MAG: ribosome recycling factor [Bacteroidia bacterium]|nr:ribosome recycling factor [Bacteroidia bacterium]MDW8334412.1 ribosome recycling factor [Bacteroidia bacterium]
MDTKSLVKAAEAAMKKSVEHFEQELTKIRAGKASPAIFDNVKIDYYGTPTPIGQTATITVVDARTLSIRPYEKKHIAPIEKAIIEANLGLNPQNDGVDIRVVLPMLTEERRKQLVKQVKEVAEDARVAIRNLRRDYNEQLKKLSKSGVAEDEIKAAENDVQKATDRHIAEIDKLVAAKEADIMKL